jgi:hypothetical protein
MGSIAAKQVAEEVLETVRKGKRPNLGKIIRKHGYSKTTSTVPSQVTKTKTYRAVLSPVVKLMERHRQRIMEELERKDLTKERYRDLMEGLDKITKNHQLLTGGETENIGVIPITNAFVSDSKQHKEDRLFTE